MKKLVLLFAAALMAVSVSAQEESAPGHEYGLRKSTFTNNMYIGINGGVATKATGHSWTKGLDPNFGVRIGKNISPVFGLAIEGNSYFSNKPWVSTGTTVRVVNTNLLSTVNFSNLFGGYKGDPRAFELTAVYGLGWMHAFGAGDNAWENVNRMTSKVGLDFQFNLGSSKAWQFYIEPSINYAFLGRQGKTHGGDAVVGNGVGDYGYKANTNEDQPAYNLNNSFVQLNAGIIYKFKNKDGRHNFTLVRFRDLSEIDGLNAQINSLRNQLNDKDAQLAAKDRQISDLQNALDECNKKPKYVKPATATNLQPTVLFRQGKSVIDPAQYAPVELIASYMKHNMDAKVEIKGYASPEGSKELNQKLSENRAEAVKTALVKKYKIAADRLTTKGCGVTDKLFEQVEFNRVATFNDNTKAE